MRKVKPIRTTGAPLLVLALGSLVLALGSLVVPRAGRAEPRGGHGQHCQHGQHGGDGHRVDMSTIHALFADPTIRRTVKDIPGGVETLTESSTPEGAENIQKHVAAMHRRIEALDPIHARDPLFAELFARAEDITMTVENTKYGVKVRETSRDPYVTKLIRAHAAVVSKFIENGRREMHINHAVPET